ncbi:hypothetical protein [Mesorhizobium sp. WSM4887]|uniref:AbiTii domain-containing protein n=1 Tax=Mesorhizobium sp. WSM4887 TaxID=3038543 RepID=UPI002416B08A|nr:hypothetical protein [Mesorhizobium sp. WSM4887]MDG4890926.1 hypothetical protein [Mesorhizobium sp. WSM4887]
MFHLPTRRERNWTANAGVQEGCEHGLRTHISRRARWGDLSISILREIQAAVLSDEADLSTIMLKLRFLASRLGSEQLEDWVKYETEGYPRDIEVPPYRIVHVTFKGTWSGPFGGGIQNAPIPSHLIDKYAGKNWTRRQVRESVAGVEELAKSEELGIDASNLILLLQGKVYADWACVSVSGEVSPIAMKEIRQAVRSRVLELTLELEKRVPLAGEVSLMKAIPKGPENGAAVTQIFNQTVYGNVTHVTAMDGAQVTLSIMAGDVGSMTTALVEAGLPQEAAKEFSEIVAAEPPKSVDKPLGNKALAWIKKNGPKAASGAWKVGSDVLTEVLTEAAMKFAGLKP